MDESKVHNEPSEAEAQADGVHIRGPSDVEVLMTPGAAFETAKRIGDAAVEAIIDQAGR